MKLTDEQKEALFAAYVKHREWFTKNGHPLSFGRMEAFKQIAEILGEQDLVDRIVADTVTHHDELKKQTVAG